MAAVVGDASVLISLASTYAYDNPVIAVFLGWALLGERVNAHMLWGALVILAGVITITITIPASAVANGWTRVRRQVAR